MSVADRLKSVVEKNKLLLSELETEITSISESETVIRLDAVRSELQGLKAAHEELTRKFSETSSENAALKNALYEQIYNEKLSILKLSSERLDAYFGANYESEMNRLSELESRTRQRIDEMTHTLRESRVAVSDEIYVKLEELTALLDRKVTEARAAYAQNSGAFSDNKAAEFEALKNERMTDDAIGHVLKKNNVEAFVGLNLINKLGILLIIIGVIAASQYSYFKLPPALKGVMMFAVGGLLLAGGEFLNRRKANIFSLGLSGGGVAVLYAALSISYFGLHILGMYLAIVLCILITAGAFVLSQRYNSQTIAAFALIGGYIPIFAALDNIAVTYSAMVYFVILNSFALLTAVRKKWRITMFIGFFLNLIGTTVIVFETTGFNYGKLDTKGIITILYVVLAFLIYTAIPLAGTYVSKIRLKASDVTLLALNTFFSALIMYGLFYATDLSDYMGILAVIFAAVYLLTGRVVETKLSGEKRVRDLFYLTGFVFVVLIIAFQFGKAWWSLGWLAEGTALSCYGILRGERRFKKSGLIIFGLCVMSFLYFDLLLRIDNLFAYKYFAVTLGSLLILGSYAAAKTLSSPFEKAFKYMTSANLWLYAMYLILSKLAKVINTVRLDGGYLVLSLAVVTTIATAYALPRIRLLTDRGMRVLSMALYVIATLALLIGNAGNTLMPSGAVSLPLRITGSLVIAFVGILSVLALRDLVLWLVMERKLGVEWYPLIVSMYFVILLTQSLITQYDLSATSGAITIIYVVTALSWIVFGFARRYAFIRRFGLALAILSVAKLFVVDLSFLSDIYRIVSYFVLGVVLVAISFVYQYFSKRLETEVPSFENTGV